MNEGERERERGKDKQSSRVSAIAFGGAFSYTIEKALTVRVDAAPALWNARPTKTKTRKDPTISVHRPNDRDEEEDTSPPLLSSPLSPVPSCSRFRCTSSSCSRRTLRAAHEVAVEARAFISWRNRTSCSDQTRVDRVSD